MIVNKGEKIGLTLQLIKSDGVSVEEEATVTYRVFDSTGMVEKVSQRSAIFNSTARSYIDTLDPAILWVDQEVAPYLIIWSVSETDDDFAPTYTEELYVTENFTEEINFLKNIEGGRWKIDKILRQMIFYKLDNVTEVARFNLFDSVGTPAYEDVFERVRVTTTTTTNTTTTTTTTV